MDIKLRKINSEDNIEIAKLIRTVLTEYGVDKPGTVFTDPTTDKLFELFQTKSSVYWIAESNNVIIGGCGIFPTIGLPSTCTELVKLYVSSDFRGKGIGELLMQKSIQSAKELKYKEIYLETLPELSNAIGLYKKLGFETLSKSMGESGHFACDLWMLKKL